MILKLATFNLRCQNDYDRARNRDFVARRASIAAQLRAAARSLEAAAGELETARQQIEDGQRDLDEAKADLADGRQKLEEAKADLADGQKKLEEAEAGAASLQVEDWILSGRENVGDIRGITTITDTIRGLSIVMTLLFLLVAVVISFAAITRMIREQRVLIGAQKALGFTPGEILRHYILYNLIMVRE